MHALKEHRKAPRHDKRDKSPVAILTEAYALLNVVVGDDGGAPPGKEGMDVLPQRHPVGDHTALLLVGRGDGEDLITARF